MKFAVLLCLCATLTQVFGDVYLHSPRGSNNRLNEQSANRNNGNRLFDSQNNNRGGYNAGDEGSAAAGGDEGKQYRMKYFQSGSNFKTGDGATELALEWTNQHGCGGNEDTDPHKQNCNIVLQYMCQDDVESATGQKSEDVMRNGVNTNTQNYNRPNNLNENVNQVNSRRNGAVDVNKGYHEPWAWYDKCYVRERNRGLFTADQILKGNNGLKYSSAIYTRQNPNGNRRGYECPEERDHFPYWHPTPWKDIAVLAENTTMCSHYQSKSFNVQPYGECLEFHSNNVRKHYSRWNNPTDCADNGGTWTDLHNFLEKAPQHNTEAKCQSANNANVRYIWAIPHDTTDGTTKECLVALEQPECKEAPWSRSNHLGNGRDGAAVNYTWVLPHFPSGNTQRCVMRIRYNISTDDYDPYNTDASFNQSPGKPSPVQQNPNVNVQAGLSPLRLAINTAQFGRTFQDRSHVFKMMPREAGFNDQRILNLNVRGKRGNIVQTFPAVEYDFFPNPLQMSTNDLVHIQWTGSNTHNNGNPAGDGQAGDAGEGTGGTDRSNLVQIQDLNENFPMPFENTTFWKNTEIMWIYHGNTGVDTEDLALNLASAGYYHCVRASNCGGNTHANYIAETKNAINNLLNNAPASYQGVLLKVKAAGSYHLMCTRNNNFTNRSQKTTIVVR